MKRLLMANLSLHPGRTTLTATGAGYEINANRQLDRLEGALHLQIIIHPAHSVDFHC